ncbi:MAG: DUF3857 domain-containing protein [Bacteroidales bacterium]|nr:DUF3857 domain-containing protein [Bacteroidales bacterium]
MKYIIIPVLVLFASGLYAQQISYADYNWNTFPQLAVPDSVTSLNGALITLERRITEVYLNNDNIFEELSILHRKIKVETHDAINRYNKIYVPVGSVIEVMDIEARFISPDGKVTEVPKSSIREIENLENRGNFQTFAIEGAELGGEIEFYYKLRTKFDPYGTVVMQGNDPRVNVEVIFAFPPKLAFMFKSYNGFADFVASQDSVLGLSFLKASVDDIPGVAEEIYATYDANIMRYEYTLTHNHYSGALRVYSFSKIAANLYNNVYQFNKQEVAAARAALKDLHLSGLPAEAQVRKVEDWIKTEIAISEDLPGTPSVDEMIRLRHTTKYGITRLLVSLLNQLGVNFELVLTCDQSARRFDPDFDGWNFLDDYLIYFPGFDKVIVPVSPAHRLGMIPSVYQQSYALFLHPIAYNDDLKTLGYEVRQLPADHYLNNCDTLMIHLKLNATEMNIEADIHRVFTGELASSFQSFWNLANKQQQDEMVNNLFTMANQGTTIRSYSVTHASPFDIAIRPLIWDIRLTANSLVEQAGEDIIIKIGESIGEQTALYQPTQRVLPVYTGAIHGYYREITFEIPQGYKVSNLDVLNTKVEMHNDNRVSCCFISGYTLTGNVLKVHSTEYYSELTYPLERFEDFRKVVNAAADFNKKTILLTRQ